MSEDCDLPRGQAALLEDVQHAALESGGVVSALPVITCCSPVEGSVNVPPTSVAARTGPAAITVAVVSVSSEAP